ncbi:hypothetical protein JKY72_05590 [Candidatus Gracilibacteria bacterium]|nr:hypothetical protein [Candidatus Gracilibacteria bacterium]
MTSIFKVGYQAPDGTSQDMPTDMRHTTNPQGLCVLDVDNEVIASVTLGENGAFEVSQHLAFKHGQIQVEGPTLAQVVDGIMTGDPRKNFALKISTTPNLPFILYN